MRLVNGNIQFLYEYDRIEKQERFRMLSIQKIKVGGLVVLGHRTHDPR